jgi:hypothetical protein
MIIGRIPLTLTCLILFIASILSCKKEEAPYYLQSYWVIDKAEFNAEPPTIKDQSIVYPAVNGQDTFYMVLEFSDAVPSMPSQWQIVHDITAPLQVKIYYYKDSSTTSQLYISTSEEKLVNITEEFQHLKIHFADVKMTKRNDVEESLNLTARLFY